MIAGQSNAVGTAKIDPADPMASSFPIPTRQWWYTGDKVDPLPWHEEPLGELAPRVEDGFHKHGPELTLGRALEAAEPGEWAVLKVAVGGTNLVNHWRVDGAYPSDECLSDQASDRIAAMTADLALEVAAVVWIQGEADASSEPAASAYAANLTQLVERWRSRHGAFRLVIDRLSSQNTYPYQDILRDQETQAVATIPDAAMVDVDDLPMVAPHFTSAGYLELGDRLSAAVLR